MSVAHRAVRFIALLACAYLVGTAAIAGDLPVQGGPGGGPFRDDCTREPGGYVAGLYFRSGAWVVAIGVKCAKFNPNSGTFGVPWNHPYYGSSGGELGVEGICPKHTYFSGIIHGYTREGDRNKYLDFVEMTCTPVMGGEPIHVCLQTGEGCWVLGRPGAPSPVVTDWFPAAKQTCPNGEAVIGIHGRHGIYVDALGLSCGPKPVPSTAETAPPPPGLVRVLQDTDVYDAPSGNATGVILHRDTPGVTLIERQAPWYHVQWAGGRGWVYSKNAPGDHYSLEF